jgi:fructose-specific phosphotransferase system IIA component
MAQESKPSLTTQDFVTLELQATDKVSAIRELAQMLERAGRVSSAEDYVADVLKREAQVPTSLGRGLAIPHARSSAVIETAVAIGRSKGIDWDPEDEEPVTLVFLLAVPLVNPSSDFIALLSGLARAMIQEEFRLALLSATDKRQIVERMAAIDLTPDEELQPA